MTEIKFNFGCQPSRFTIVNKGDEKLTVKGYSDTNDRINLLTIDETIDPFDRVGFLTPHKYNKITFSHGEFELRIGEF